MKFIIFFLLSLISFAQLGVSSINSKEITINEYSGEEKKWSLYALKSTYRGNKIFVENVKFDIFLKDNPIVLNLSQAYFDRQRSLLYSNHEVMLSVKNIDMQAKGVHIYYNLGRAYFLKNVKVTFNTNE